MWFTNTVIIVNFTSCTLLPCFFDEDEAHMSVLCFFWWWLVSRWIWTFQIKQITGNTDNLFLQKGCVDLHYSFNLYRYGFKLMHTLKWTVLNCFSCCWSFSDGSPLNTSYKDDRDNTELSQTLINCTQELFLQCITDALN